MALEFGNYLAMSDVEVRRHMAGCEGFVFAAGVDERIEGPPPIYEMFRKYNIDPLERLLRIARECGVRHAVVCGSYFACFDRAWPHLRLADRHPYIRSRVDQARMALSFADGTFDVAVLELPYIFGAQPGRRPGWVFLVERIRGMRGRTLYPRGGTAMVTVRQVGQAIAGALERNRGGRNIPVGWYDLKWTEFLAIVHRHMGMPGRKVVTIPTWLFTLAAFGIRRQQRRAGHEGGLDLVPFARVMASECFLDRAPMVALGVEDDDIDAAIGESSRASLEVLDGRTGTVAMKGE
jgi:nucleoside-diphosphate-sugar epimerase